MHIYTALLYNIIYIYNIKSTYITFCGDDWSWQRLVVPTKTLDWPLDPRLGGGCCRDHRCQTGTGEYGPELSGGGGIGGSVAKPLVAGTCIDYPPVVAVKAINHHAGLFVGCLVGGCSGGGKGCRIGDALFILPSLLFPFPSLIVCVVLVLVQTEGGFCSHHIDVLFLVL